MRSEEVNNLEHLLIKCITACETCSSEDLNEGINELANCAIINRDCADICTLTSRLLARKSPYLDNVMKLCIQVCIDCEIECRKHENHDHCRKCAEICHECHQACEEYLGVDMSHGR